MQKPTSMTVLGILNICFAGLGLFGGCWGLIAPFIPMPGSEMLEDLYADGTFLMVAVCMGLVGLASKLAMGVSGIGLVKGKAWGRSLGNLWAVFSILYGLVVVVVQATYVMPKTFDAQQQWMQSQPNGQQSAQMMQSMETPTLILTVVMGILMATVYQVLFLILNNRKAVKDYLAAGGADAAGVGPAQPYGQPAPPSEPTDSPW